MEILATNRLIFSWLSIYSLTKDTSRKMKFLQILFSACILLSQMLAMSASVAFFYENVTFDVTNSTYGAVEITGLGSVVYTFIIAYFLRRDIDKIFVNLQEIYDSEFSIQWILIGYSNNMKF